MRVVHVQVLLSFHVQCMSLAVSVWEHHHTRVQVSPERPQSAQDTNFSGLLDFLLKVLSPRQKSQIGLGLAIGLPCGDAHHS